MLDVTFRTVLVIGKEKALGSGQTCDACKSCMPFMGRDLRLPLHCKRYSLVHVGVDDDWVRPDTPVQQGEEYRVSFSHYVDESRTHT